MDMASKLFTFTFTFTYVLGAVLRLHASHALWLGSVKVRRSAAASAWYGMIRFRALLPIPLYC